MTYGKLNPGEGMSLKFHSEYDYSPEKIHLKKFFAKYWSIGSSFNFLGIDFFFLSLPAVSFSIKTKDTEAPQKLGGHRKALLGGDSSDEEGKVTWTPFCLFFLSKHIYVWKAQGKTAVTPVC